MSDQSPSLKLRALFTEQTQHFQVTVASIVEPQLQPITSAQDDVRRITSIERNGRTEKHTTPAPASADSCSSKLLRMKLKLFEGNEPLDHYLEQANIVRRRCNSCACGTTTRSSHQRSGRTSRLSFILPSASSGSSLSLWRKAYVTISLRPVTISSTATGRNIPSPGYGSCVSGA